MLMDLQLKDEWNWFCEGAWTREAPTKTGRYHIADVDGIYSGNGFLVVHVDGAPYYVKAGRRSPTAAVIWGGFFWSVPEPEMPPVPADLPK